MAQGVQLPDGSAVAIRSGETPQDAYNRAKQMYPESFAEKTLEEGPKSGFMPALKAGFSNLKGDVAALAGRTGIMGLPEAEKYIAEQEAYQKKTFAPTKEGFFEAPLANIKELAGGSLPYMAAPLVAGAAALPVAGVAGTVLGLGAAGLTSAAQFTGSGLSRQMKPGEGMANKSLGETNLADAALASIPQAVLDTVSLRMIPGLGKMFERAGVGISKQAAQDLAKEGIKKTAADYALATGKTMGVEGLTEAGQQVFERMQAGLNITDANARAEYFDNFIGGAVLGGILAPAGRYVERGQEQTRFDTDTRTAQVADRAAAEQVAQQAAAEEETYKQSQPYMDQVDQQYKDLQGKYNELKAQATADIADDDLSGKAIKADAAKALKEFINSSETQDVVQEYNRIQKLKPQEPTPEDTETTATVPSTTATTETTAETTAGAPPSAPVDIPFADTVAQIQAQIEALQTQAQGASPAELIGFGAQHKELKKQLAQVNQINAAMNKANELGKTDLAGKHAKRLQDLQAQIAAQVPPVTEAPQVTPADVTEASQVAPVDTTQETAAAPKTRKPKAVQPLAPYTGIAEQSLMFPETGVVESTINVGQGKQPDKSRQELIAEFQAAKQVRDRLGMQNAIEQMRTLAERSEARSEAARGNGVPQGELSKELPAMMGQKLTATGSQAPSRELVNAAKIEITPQTLRRQVESLPQNLSPESEQLVGRILGNFDEFTVDPERTQLAAGFLQDVRTGVDTARARDVAAELDKIEAAKQPEQAGIFSAEDLPVIEGPRKPLPVVGYSDAALPPKPSEQQKAPAAWEKASAELETQRQTLDKEKETRVQTATAEVAKRENTALQAYNDAAVRHNTLKVEQEATLAPIYANYVDAMRNPVANKMQAAKQKIDTSIAYQTAKENKTVALAETQKAMDDAKVALTKIRDEVKSVGTTAAEQIDLAQKEARVALSRKGLEVEAQRNAAKAAEPVRIQVPKTDTSLADRETADAAKRLAENKRAERLSTIPGESISFEAHRQALATLDDVSPRLDELAVKAADAALPKTTRDKANREIKKLSLARKFLESSGEGNGELRLKAEEELAKLQEKIKTQATAVAENSTKSRKQELAKSKRREKELTTQVKSFTSRAERTPIVTPTEKTRQAAENRATRFMQLQEALNIEGTTGALPARDIGPTVRKAQAAGNIRSGDIETTGERIINPGLKPEQGGTVKQPTPAEMRQIIREASELANERVKANAPLTAAQIRDLDVANQGSLLEAAFNMRAGLERNKRELQEKMDFSAKSPNPSEKNTILRKEREIEMERINGDLYVAKENENKLSKLFSGEAPAEETQKTVKKAKKTRAQKVIEDLSDEGMQRGTSGANDTPLSEQNIARLRSGNVGGVLTQIAGSSANQVARRVAGKVQSILGENGVSSRLVDKTTADNNDAPGMISKDGKRISINERTGLSEESVLHESVHAATMFELDKPDEKLTPDQRVAKKGLTKMMEQVKAADDFDNEVIKDGDIHEFVAEGNASKVVQDYMRGKTFDNRNMWQKFKDFLLRLVGVKTPSSENMLNKFLDMSEEFMRAKEAGAADLPAAKLRAASYKSKDALSELADLVVARPQTLREKAGSNIALQFEMQTADMRAGVIKALNNAVEDPNTMGSTKLFRQAVFSITAADQHGAVTQMALSNGPPTMFKDSKGYYEVRSTMKNDAGAVFEAIQGIPDSYGNTEAKMGLASVYMIAQRAMNKGLKKLDLGALGVTEKQVTEAMASVNADPKLKTALENARTKYNAFNRGMIEWLSSPQVAAITQADAKAYLKDEDYVPYYRVRADGVAELVFGGEKTITIGDIRHQPYLAELKGGNDKIMPLDKSIMRNTMLLVTKGMNNMAMKNVAYAMQAAGQGLGPVDKMGKPTSLMPVHKGKGGANADNSIIRWTQEPDPNKPDDKGDRWLRIQTTDTMFGGVPAELIIKSLEGAHLTLPAFLKWGGIAGDLLRSGVTRTPIYLARQLFRDPFAATATSGLDYGPITAIFKANREFLKITAGKSETGAKMIEKGLMQSGMFEGDPANMSKMALQLASGKSQGVFDRLFAKADKLALQADAATRALIYENAIKNGLSEVEASQSVRESMNFNKRGLSPTIQYASRMIPFFNAQIQGLSVLFKAATGNMPANDVLKIKRKFFNNAMLLTGFGIAYAMAMDDDDYYKNAKPRDRYTNFFVPLPGVDEPLKLPIPYEFGFFFSAGVALADAIKGEVDTPQQLRALKDMFVGAIPGASSNLMPQIIKPIAEVYANKSFFSGNALVSSRLEKLDPVAQYNSNTTELAKFMAKMVPGLSPIQIEHIVSGYLGQIPLMVVATTNDLFRDGKDEPTRKLSEMPLIGSSFQRKYGGEEADVVYKLATEATQAKRTFDDYRKKGKIEDAKDYLSEHRAEIMVAPMAMQYQKLMGALRTQEDLIRNSNASSDAKEKRIDALNAQRQLQSERYLKAIRRAEEASGRTTPP